MSSYLPSLPRVLPGESLMSWMQRACQVYDLTFDRFHQTFGTQGGGDADLCLSPEQIDRIAFICKLPVADFVGMKTLAAMAHAEPKFRQLLLTQRNGHADYRYCVMCLRGDRIPYFRVEWRYKHWTICPIHRCKLNKQCMYCSSPLTTHRASLGGARNPPPTPSLAYCAYCGGDFRSMNSSIEQFADDAAYRAWIGFQRYVAIACRFSSPSMHPTDSSSASVNDLLRQLTYYRLL